MKNILLITVEQLHADCVGMHKLRQVHTPNWDMLERNGVSFARSFTVAASCVPSRTSLLTGQYPHTHRVYNGTKAQIPDHYLALPQYLADMAGYHTALTGKKHFGQWAKAPFQSDLGDKNSGYMDYLKGLGLLDTYEREAKTGMADFMSYPTEIPYAHSEPVFTADRTMEAIDAAGDKPFFISTNFQNAHPPYRTPADAPKIYDPAAIDLTEIRRNTEEDRRLVRMRPGSARAGIENIWSMESRGEAAYRQALAHYYGMISMVDDNIGRLLRHLEDTGKIDNTIIILTADHGDLAGEYGMIGKSTRGHFEAIMRVPLVCYHRGTFGQERVHSLVENIDIFPTVCEMLGLEIPHTVQGQSFSSVLKYSGSGPGPTPQTREAAFWDSLFCKSVVTRNARLSYHYNSVEWGELYDLREDPDERHNRFDDPAYRDLQDSLMRELMRWYIRTDQPIGWGGSPSRNAPDGEFRYLSNAPQKSVLPPPNRSRLG